ncbi:hypothetical protein [Frankia sp. AgB32]|uniref:hypothetical protein n=1 Tax=Frankia sp. AgB32 TaxID=631119 RepID=UPI00200D879F|nr:hypothetical protein [Frankia sp. AgB32]MCK9893940.1 hypothetical protein [Frankia sp. AgB32]
METRAIETYIRSTFAEYAGLTEEELFSNGVTLAEAVNRSPRMTNSIDLMETFARTSNAVRKDYGVRVRLPALPLDTPMSGVLATFLAEYDREAGTAAPSARPSVAEMAV